jgi:peptide/nickel transport system ATP-binding protein
MNSLNPVARIRDQFFDVMREHGSADQARRERVVELLGEVGLHAAVADMYPHELSGGMRQRTLMAMAVALEPDLLIADEPTTALDVTIQRIIIQNLADLAARHGVTILVITHDMGVHAQLDDRVAVMYAGKLVEVGDTREVFKNPQAEYTRQLIASIPTLDVRQRK